MQQCALDRLMLPVDDHHLAGIAARCHVEDGVVALFGVQDAADLLGIDGNVIGSSPAPYSTAGIMPLLRKRRASFLRALSSAWLLRSFGLFCSCCSHILFLYKNSLLTEVSLCID